MDWLLEADWKKVFVPEIGLLEIVARGTLVYVGLLVLLRLVLKRQQGAMSTTDLLVVVLIADAAQNGMADEYHSVPEGLLLVATILFWNFSLDWLAFRVPVLERWLKPTPVEVVKDGRMLRKNMASELALHKNVFGFSGGRGRPSRVLRANDAGSAELHEFLCKAQRADHRGRALDPVAARRRGGDRVGEAGVRGVRRADQRAGLGPERRPLPGRRQEDARRLTFR